MQTTLCKSPEAGQFFGTFDMKAFVAVQPADGGNFKLDDYIKNGNVLEVEFPILKVATALNPYRKRKSHRKSMACLRWLPLLFKVAAQPSLLMKELMN